MIKENQQSNEDFQYNEKRKEEEEYCDLMYEHGYPEGKDILDRISKNDIIKR